MKSLLNMYISIYIKQALSFIQTRDLLDARAKSVNLEKETQKNIIWNKTEMSITFNGLHIYLFKNFIIVGKSSSSQSIILYYSFQSSEHVV